jgi:hypothetical protein
MRVALATAIVLALFALIIVGQFMDDTEPTSTHTQTEQPTPR